MRCSGNLSEAAGDHAKGVIGSGVLQEKARYKPSFIRFGFSGRIRIRPTRTRSGGCPVFRRISRCIAKLPARRPHKKRGFRSSAISSRVAILFGGKTGGPISIDQYRWKPQHYLGKQGANSQADNHQRDKRHDSSVDVAELDPLGCNPFQVKQRIPKRRRQE